MTVGPSVFQIRTLWRCSLGLSGVHLTEVIFHFSCQPGLEGPSASLSRQRKPRMWWAESLFQSRCFQVDTTEAETTFCHWGPTNRDCAVMMWPQTDPRVEAINSNYTPHLQSTGLFLFLKVVILPRGMFSLNLSVFATFQIDCRLLINRPAAIILTQLWRFQFWLFIHFISVVPTKKCAARAEAQMTDRASQSALPKLQF